MFYVSVPPEAGLGVSICLFYQILKAFYKSTVFNFLQNHQSHIEATLQLLFTLVKKNSST